MKRIVLACVVCLLPLGSVYAVNKSQVINTKPLKDGNYCSKIARNKGLSCVTVNITKGTETTADQWKQFQNITGPFTPPPSTPGNCDSSKSGSDPLCDPVVGLCDTAYDSEQRCMNGTEERVTLTTKADRTSFGFLASGAIDAIQSMKFSRFATSVRVTGLPAKPIKLDNCVVPGTHHPQGNTANHVVIDLTIHWVSPKSFSANVSNITQDCELQPS